MKALEEQQLQRIDQITNEAVETLAALEMVAQGRVVPGEAVHAWLRSWGRENESEPPSIGQ